MNTHYLRFKNSKKGVTPVIATIILIAGTLVLALVVGAYTFGLFGSNVKQIQLNSAILTSGPAAAANTGAACAGANFQLTLNNPGGTTEISALTLSSGGNPVSIPNYFNTVGGNTCVAVTLGTTGPSLPAGATTPITLYFGAVLTSGQTYNYVITFVNGQSIQGVLTAQ
ncbi:MAG TPA: archaellin/type IV pilin N-terminal domain-containing protein [Nitrososphaerales archaeon]|nr:archaellin/type IV pilin N-terminal domain-containing protein [Nitrososphaerales archaeon]